VDLGLNGKVAIVGGSSRGLGKATAVALAAEGASLVICARNEKILADAHAEISKVGSGKVHSVVMDMSEREDVARLVKETIDTFGKVDILVNNAGGPPSGGPLSISEGQWQTAINQNLLSIVRLSRSVVPHMKEAGWGRIVNILSTSVKQPVDGLLLSNSVRMAVVGFSKTLADEVAPYSITVNNILPGSILTDRIKELDLSRSEQKGISLDDALSQRASSIPMRRIGRPEEFGSLACFLASERASYITGVSIQVDGGALRSVY